MLQTISLPGGFACNPGYLYAAVNHEETNRTKVGQSLNPWIRRAQAYTWEPQAGWSLVQAVAVADMGAAEKHVHRCLLRFAVPHLYGKRNSEHFELETASVVRTMNLTAKRQAEAVAQLRALMRNALETGTALDAMRYLLEQPLANRNLRLAILQALDGDTRMSSALAQRGMFAVPAEQVVLFDRRDALPVHDDPWTTHPESGPQGHAGRHPFVGSIFAGHWLEVLEGYAGFDRRGQLLRIQDIGSNLVTAVSSFCSTPRMAV